MLTKLLVTALVIAFAWATLKRSSRVKTTKKPAADLGQSILRRYMVTGTLAVLLLGSASYLGWYWYDGSQVLSVTIVSPNQSGETVYQVKKRDISQHEIVTLDGITIRLSNQERVIIATSAK